MWPAPGGGTVYSGGGAPFYHHKDWMGNARVVSNESFPSVYVDRAYAPYGEMYDAFGVTSTGAVEMFAGLRSILDNGVMWDTPNRELSSVGRWLSPDPAGLSAVDPSNPQSWNRYAYVLNNPLAYIDSTGLDCVTVNGDGSTSTPVPGDCPNLDPNNEFYFDGTVDQNNVPFVDPSSGNVLASVNGQLQCSGDSNCAAYNNVTTVNVNGGAGPFVITLTYGPTNTHFTPAATIQQWPPKLTYQQADAICSLGAQIGTNGFVTPNIQVGSDPGTSVAQATKVYEPQGEEIRTNADQVNPTGSMPSVEVNPNTAIPGAGAQGAGGALAIVTAKYGAKSYCMSLYRK